MTGSSPCSSPLLVRSELRYTKFPSFFVVLRSTVINASDAVYILWRVLDSFSAFLFMPSHISPHRGFGKNHVLINVR